MNAKNDDELELEDLLRQVSLAGPSARLDQRMDALLLPQSQPQPQSQLPSQPRSRWLGPLLGFAAGVVLTATLLPAISKPAQKPAPSPVATAPVPPKQPVPQTLFAEPREVVDAVEGEIDGVQVRLQHTQSEVDVWGADARPDAGRDHIVLADQTTIEPVESY